MAKTVKLSMSSVEDTVFCKFKQLIITKHGTLRKLGEELTKAMQLWIKNEEG